MKTNGGPRAVILVLATLILLVGCTGTYTWAETWAELRKEAVQPMRMFWAWFIVWGSMVLWFMSATPRTFVRSLTTALYWTGYVLIAVAPFHWLLTRFWELSAILGVSGLACVLFGIGFPKMRAKQKQDDLM